MRESKAYQQIMEEGELKAKRMDILKLLQIRFGPDSTAELDVPINALDDLESLSQLFEVAAQCRRLDDFHHALGPLAVQR
jgi:hypothetical protein